MRYAASYSNTFKDVKKVRKHRECNNSYFKIWHSTQGIWKLSIRRTYCSIKRGRMNFRNLARRTSIDLRLFSSLRVYLKSKGWSWMKWIFKWRNVRTKFLCLTKLWYSMGTVWSRGQVLKVLKQLLMRMNVLRWKWGGCLSRRWRNDTFKRQDQLKPWEKFQIWSLCNTNRLLKSMGRG